jgi:CBS domain-containing protein
MKTIKELLDQTPLYTVDTDFTVHETVMFMAEKGIGLVPVLNQGKLLGVFSERDLVKRVIAQGKEMHQVKVKDVMTTNLVISSIDEPYNSVLMKMNDAKIRHILIIDNNSLVGVLSMRDLLEIDISAQKETVEVLNHYIYSKYSFDIEPNT